MNSRNIRLEIAYDGSGFSGWQKQPGIRTVQGAVEKALSEVMDENTTLYGASRTDAGVHAFGQSASFHTSSGIPTDRIPVALNDRFDDIRVMLAEDVPDGFHARFDTVGKTYVYKVSHGADTDIFDRLYIYSLKERLDTDKMRKVSGAIVGTHDFAGFQSAGGQPRETTVRTVLDVSLSGEGNRIDIIVTGDGFLYNMVRIIVGTMIEAGLGRLSEEKAALAVERADRRLAGPVAPAAGLYLQKVWYSEDEMKRGLAWTTK
ncbi:MAG: tRNA pseudouridine(38-40) synthase TruA [Clostridiales Family XIII bacterium]|jgi:tRNA pseudouridine38-40 synthase|nr:tRNA pseudouridine(38-40) synthase TruA [Clostridiales Family XIII bacterium]